MNSLRRSRPKSAVIAAAGLFAAGSLALAGCSEIDIDQLESDIESKLAVENASCPDVDSEVGQTFECTATLEGEDVTISVEQTSEDQVLFSPPVPAGASEDGAGAGETTTTEESAPAEE